MAKEPYEIAKDSLYESAYLRRLMLVFWLWLVAIILRAIIPESSWLNEAVLYAASGLLGFRMLLFSITVRATMRYREEGLLAGNLVYRSKRVIAFEKLVTWSMLILCTATITIGIILRQQGATPT